MFSRAGSVGEESFQKLGKIFHVTGTAVSSFHLQEGTGITGSKTFQFLCNFRKINSWCFKDAYRQTSSFFYIVIY